MPLGLFGKLPAKGDFITRAMPPEVLSFWENWLEKSMSGAKHQLAGEWGPVYEASPVWRFWVGPGIFGHAMAGALTASVDKVGRQFPLTLVLSGMGPGHPVPPLSDPMEDWYGMLERALLSAKAAHFDGDIDGFLAALPAPNAAACAIGEDRRNAFFAYGEHGLGQMLADVRDHDHQLAAFERSYWWTGGNEHVGPGMIAMDGMPDAAGFMAMLRGFGPPARVSQPPASPRPAAAAAAVAGASAARGRETTVPPRRLIGEAEEAEAAAAWGVEASREDLAWAAPSETADDAAWAAALTGDEAGSPFGAPGDDWDFLGAGPAKTAKPEPEPDPVPEPDSGEEAAEEDLFGAGPEPYGIGSGGVAEDVYASLNAPAEAETGMDEASGAGDLAGEEGPEGRAEDRAEGGAGPEAEAPASAPDAQAIAPDRGPVVDVSMVGGEDFDIPGDLPDGPEEIVPEKTDTAPAGEETAVEADDRAGTPTGEGEDSPFGTPGDAGEGENGLGQRKAGLRGFFSLRGRGKD